MEVTFQQELVLLCAPPVECRVKYVQRHWWSCFHIHEWMCKYSMCFLKITNILAQYPAYTSVTWKLEASRAQTPRLKREDLLCPNVRFMRGCRAHLHWQIREWTPVITVATLKHQRKCPHTVSVTDGLVCHDFQLYPHTKREAPSRASNLDGYLPDIVLHL